MGVGVGVGGGGHREHDMRPVSPVKLGEVYQVLMVGWCTRQAALQS